MKPNSDNLNPATICAIASGLGRAGIGIVRISGVLVGDIARQMLGVLPKARVAHYGSFFDENGVEIDKGVAIFFPNPHSFTGEDVLELQGHGGRLVMHTVLKSSVALGAVLAQPGEFSKRAFLNGKMDLLQAEAVADMIEANSRQSARCALRSLSGEFSKQLTELTQKLIKLRVFIEATIDFSDEEIDFLASHQVVQQIEQIRSKIQVILKSSEQGAILREGLNVAIVGKPNAGKSSLLNALTRDSSAIVTDIAGTTRDVLKETIQLDGLPLNMIDTAGLRDSSDVVERAGIERALLEIERADVILLVFEATDGRADESILPSVAFDKPILWIKNKVDLTQEALGKTQVDIQIENQTENQTDIQIEHQPNNSRLQIALCAKQSRGVEILTQELARVAGVSDTGEGVLLARERHIVALNTTLECIQNALLQLKNEAGELVAEELNQAAKALGSITGEFSSDDLLGEIFASFCIGK